MQQDDGIAATGEADRQAPFRAEAGGEKGAEAATLAIEDSTNGIASALNAGMTVVTVPPHFHPPTAEVLARTTVLDGLDELSYDLVEGLIPSAR